MNYIWDYVIKGEKQGIKRSSIKFIKANNFSPYMELSINTLNSEKAGEEIEVNPYYRFYELFKGLFDVNYSEYIEYRATLFDILMHFLTEIDLMQGMNKHEYYLEFLFQEIYAGDFGMDMIEKIKQFNREERDILLENILKLYKTGEALHLLKDTTEKIFKKSILYIYTEGKDEVLFFVNRSETEENIQKVQFVKDMFLPIKFHMEIYWNVHFGVIEVGETMLIDKIELC